MELIIHDKQTISKFQEAFRNKFPYLKLVFYKTSPEGGSGFGKDEMITDNRKTLGYVRQYAGQNHIIEGNLIIFNSTRVESLENDLLELYGLPVQVFRRSGNAWLRTTTTDTRTLAELNRLGEEMDEPVVIDPEFDADIY